MGVISPHLVVKTMRGNRTAPETDWSPPIEREVQSTTFKGKGRIKEGEGTGWWEEQILRREAPTVPQTGKEEGMAGDNEIQSLCSHFGNTQ